ncbi:hypothetical protein [Streptomyces sp. NPDC007172]|uniref:hypothetical protein n=1 Tax=Streptomyces sp. NPDC007172 TaxID=3364776 RepID=UPI003686B101
MINTVPPREERGAPATAVMLVVSGFPALLALLPLALSGAQQLLADPTSTHSASAGIGAVMLIAAVLPFAGGLAMLGYGRAWLSRATTWEASAAVMFVAGLIGCGIAMFYAA